MEKKHNRSHVETAQRDVLTGGIVIAATLMFVWTGGNAISQAIKKLVGLGAEVESILMTTMLLNVALILFGYRRYRDLQAEVRQRTVAEERASSLAATDPLTGFLNRRSLMEQGASMIVRAREIERTVVLMMFDLDHFKTVNDIHGHAAGDLVLNVVAKRISNILPPHALMARLGGDEFACAYLFDSTVPHLVEQTAEELVSAISKPVLFEGSHLIVSTSLGLARSDFDYDNIETLLRRADIAMYSAKNNGRNRHVWFDESMERELRRRNALEAGMRAGIPAGEFIPFYEQQVDLLTGRLLGFEMLARWESPTMGPILPDVFIPIAEETGLIGDLSFSVMRQAFLDARDWDPSLTLSVNISPGQLKDGWLSQKILRLLVETGFPPNRLEIEITESSLFENLELAQSIVSSLKNQGIRIALDDFGTGYSSLSHLRALPFDRIKIDRSFVQSMGENSESAAIVQAIAKLGESLGLPVTAEGVETKAIETLLLQLGLVKGQGWHFGKPMSVGQTRRLLADRDMLPAIQNGMKAFDGGHSHAGREWVPPVAASDERKTG